MENLDELWTRIGSVSKEEVIVAVLKDEIEIFDTFLGLILPLHFFSNLEKIESAALVLIC